MEEGNPEKTRMADDLDDINTLVNLLELRSQLRIESGHFESELD
jgi:hypothetical protein